MADVVNRFKNLLAQVEAETGERPTYEDIYNETGIALSTLSSYGKGTVSRYDSRTIAALVDFFNKRLTKGCDLSDLLEYPPVNGQDIRQKTTTATGQPMPA